MNNISLILNQSSIQMPNYRPEMVQNFTQSTERYDNIFMGNCLGQLGFNLTQNIITDCISKLNLNGKLKIHDIDIGVVAQRIANGMISIADTNNILCGRGSYHSIFSLVELTQQMPSCKIVSKKIDGIEFVLELEKISE